MPDGDGADGVARRTCLLRETPIGVQGVIIIRDGDRPSISPRDEYRERLAADGAHVVGAQDLRHEWTEIGGPDPSPPHDVEASARIDGERNTVNPWASSRKKRSNPVLKCPKRKRPPRGPWQLL